MANYIIDGSLLTNIAAAIRSKKGVSTTYTPAAMATAISGLSAKVNTASSQSSTVAALNNKTIAANKTLTVAAGNQVDLSKAAVIKLNIGAFSGNAWLSDIDVGSNKLTVTAGASGVHISSAVLYYHNLKIT